MPQVHPVFLWGLLTEAAGEGGWCGEGSRGSGGWVVLLRRRQKTHCSRRRSLRTPGPSRAGSSEMRMASSMAASSPEPPSPRRAGPKHSGLRMSSRTTTLAFSSTLSPGHSRGVRRPHEPLPRDPPQEAQGPAPPTRPRLASRPCPSLLGGTPAQARPGLRVWATPKGSFGQSRQRPHPPTVTSCLTVDEDSEAQEVQVALTTTGVPTNVRVAFGQEHGATLEATACQVGHHLGIVGGSARPTPPSSPRLTSLLVPGALQSVSSLYPSANSNPHHLPSSPIRTITAASSLGLLLPAICPHHTVRGTLQIPVSSHVPPLLGNPLA